MKSNYQNFIYRKINNDLFKTIVQFEWLKLKILQKNRNEEQGMRSEERSK
jgi:hypothetical protein